jgi:hypothetical protein
MTENEKNPPPDLDGGFSYSSLIEQNYIMNLYVSLGKSSTQLNI